MNGKGAAQLVWTLTGGLNTARRGYTTTLLPDGRVLVVGGFNRDGALRSAELYRLKAEPASEPDTELGKRVLPERAAEWNVSGKPGRV
jgi:hypothetical protein